MFQVPGEATSLVVELAEPVPPPLRDRFFTRVRSLLPPAATPAAIVAACARVLNELLNAPPGRQEAEAGA
jgi:hypothetical protein